MTRTHARIRPRLQAALLASVATLAILSGLAADARAYTGELVQSAGDPLFRYARAEQIDATRTLFVNGAALQLSSGSTRDPVGAVLDVFAERCDRVAGGFGDQLTRLLRKRANGRSTMRFDPVLRGGSTENAYLACLDFGHDAIDAARLIARLRAFAASGDLSHVAGVRFVWARRSGEYTGYVALWNDGALPLRSMFPARGDAPGVDVAGVARPHGARRVLSAWQEDAAPLLVSYAANAGPDVLEREYRAQLSATGISVLAVAPAAPDASHTWSIEHGATRVALTIAERDGGGSLITLATLR